ncbi:MAG TPA: ribonuclease [Oxalobacteraceae bacterium]|jgi:ribonuclease T1|nr:ribonuclease [Oxalobacteraceae bacterium]HCN91322.1 ribonuclease [Oxalobacteraceae bacterium]
MYVYQSVVQKQRREFPVNAKSLKNWMFSVAALLFSVSVVARDASWQALVAAGDLPREAQQTLVLIRQGGPFPFAKDGVTFGNYEHALPKRARGYYHEFTVESPGARNRGARRIIVGGKPVSSLDRYYTNDHYMSFRRIKE